MPRPDLGTMNYSALRYAASQGVILHTHTAPRWHRWVAIAGLLLLGMTLGAIATAVVNAHTPQADLRPEAPR